MAKISTYVIDGTIVDGDKVIGSDANNDMQTKNYTVGDLVNYFAASIGNDYLVPYLGATGNVDLGAFNLLAGSVQISNNIIANGSVGIPGQVLMSQGPGLPSVWSFNAGGQGLNSVLNISNTSVKDILLSNAFGSAIIDIEKIYGSAAIYLNNFENSTASYWNTGDIQLQSDTGYGVNYLANKIRFLFGGNYVDIRPGIYSNQSFLFPSVGGYIPVSVNGNFADSSGNIIVPVGTGTVTYVEFVSGTGIAISGTNPITSTGTVTITNSAPDQIVVLTSGAGISVTGSYPNFTISATGTGTVTAVTASSPLASSGGATPNITIQQASGTQGGYLSSADWTTFNSKQDPITLTTTGTSGAATFIGNTLNIPDYSGGGSIPTLEQVLISGNISEANKWIYLYDTASQDKGIELDYNQIKGYDNSGGSFLMNRYGLQCTTDQFLLPQLKEVTLNADSLTFFYDDGIGNSTYSLLNRPILLPGAQSYTATLPNATGTLAMSVNGVPAGNDGSITIPVGTGTVTGSGTATQVAFWDTSSSIAGDSNLYWDNTNKRLGIGTFSPLTYLHAISLSQLPVQIIEADSSYASAGSGQIRIQGHSDNNQRLELGYNTVTDVGFLQAYIDGFPLNLRPLTLNPDGGNVGIGTTDPQVRFQVSQGAPGGMAFPYEAAVVERDGDTKFGVYTSTTNPTIGGGASYVLGATNILTEYNYYPGFEYQLDPDIVTLNNKIRFNYIGRNPSGFVYQSIENILNIFASGVVSINAASAFIPTGIKPQLLLGLNTSSNALDIESVLSSRISSLGGGGTQMVVADNTGVLSVQAIPSGSGTLQNVLDNSIVSNSISGLIYATDQFHLNEVDAQYGIHIWGASSSVNKSVLSGSYQGTGTSIPDNANSIGFYTNSSDQYIFGNAASSDFSTYTPLGIDATTGMLKNMSSWPTASGGIQHAIASGTDTYTATITGVTSYTDGDAYIIQFTNGNTTGCTLNINGLGAITLYRNNDGALIGGDIAAGGEMICVYDNTLPGFRVIGTTPNTLVAYVTNDDSVTITKGQVVYAFGGTGDRMTVKLANNTAESTSAQTVGIVMSASIAANQKGFIITQGLLDGLSILPTATFTDGDALYLGATAGAITNVKPSAPNHLVYLGNVTTASNGAAGRWYVRVQNGYELQELHNVAISGVANNDGLFYESSTSLWKNKSIATVLGYTPASAATTISTTSPLSGGGDLSANRTLSISQATSSTNGYLSSTDWTTFNNKGYTLPFTTAATNLINNTTYFFGNMARALVSTASVFRVYIPQTGTIKKVYITSYASTTIGSAENLSLYIRINNNAASDTLVATVGASTAVREFINISLNTSVTAGDYIEMKLVTPNPYVTPPAGITFGGTVYIQ